ncbi:MAG TPA: right-handed parallel beta-helix repeat-containing protein, partial [Thermoanaerobaculia bacterium]|nr:right-handed parallel beta-helix repeat-containing protein [Thermoanaerobaculia bacterium]
MSVVLSTFLFAGTASAKELFVATSGNDANLGTIAAPFATIKKASSLALPGDVISVRGGVYYGPAGVMAKGTAAARITVRSYPGETAVIDGTNMAAGSDLFSLYKAEYIDVVGFEVRNSKRIGINVYESKNIRVRDNHIHHSHRHAVYVGGATTGISADIYIDGNDIHDNVLENQNLTMVDGGWAGAVCLSQTTRGGITNNRVYRNYGEGMGSGLSTNVNIEGNVVSDNYSGYIYIDNGQHMTVNRNLLYNTGDTRFYRLGKPAPGIGIANEAIAESMPSSDIVVTNNIVIGTRWGFYYGAFENGGGLKNVTVANNTFYRATESLVRIELDAHAGTVVKNNIFYSVGNAAASVAGSGVAFQNNLWYGAAPTGLAVGAGDIYADPMLVNPGTFNAADYKLKAISPAVHTALDATPATTDFFGSKRTPSNDLGAHEQSTTLGSSAPATPSTDPARELAGRANGTTIELTWTASTTEGASYKVYRDNALVADVTGTRFTDNGRSAATTYNYEVVAVSAIGNAGPGAYITVTTAPAGDSQKP